MVLCAGLSLAMVFTGCKSSESAYKKAYQKAKMAEASVQQETAPEPTYTPTVQSETPVVAETPVVTPVETKPVTETKVEKVDDVEVRQEKVTVVRGAGLKDFSVVVGAFSVIANAEGLQQRLKDAGYPNAQVVKNEERNLYRVVAATFDSKADAVNSRNTLRGSQFNPNNDAWLLYNTNK